MPNPSCNAKMHPMRRHATYERELILWDPEKRLPREGRMEILRLKCSSCGKIHAVLAMDMIPFFSYSIHAFLRLVAMCLGPDRSVRIQRRKPASPTSFSTVSCRSSMNTRTA